MKSSFVFMTLAGCVVGALIGAAVGATSVAVVRAWLGGFFPMLDGAWLGATFVVPLGGIAGLFIAVDGKTSR